MDCSLLSFVTNKILKLELVFLWEMLDIWIGDGRGGEGIHGEFLMIGRQFLMENQHSKLLIRMMNEVQVFAPHIWFQGLLLLKGIGAAIRSEFFDSLCTDHVSLQRQLYLHL